MGLPCKTGQTLKNVTSYALKKENGTYVYIITITASNHTVQTIKVNAENGGICS
ncbi:hypothetical protein EH5_00084 [Bacillus subtilis]|jgi:uncharacterized membrane protein YkoI|nr:hypothetical protein EH5_00084 [Bacillus subtilis]